DDSTPPQAVAQGIDQPRQARAGTPRRRVKNETNIRGGKLLFVLALRGQHGGLHARHVHHLGINPVFRNPEERMNGMKNPHTRRARRTSAMTSSTSASVSAAESGSETVVLPTCAAW